MSLLADIFECNMTSNFFTKILNMLLSVKHVVCKISSLTSVLFILQNLAWRKTGLTLITNTDKTLYVFEETSAWINVTSA